MDEFVLDEEVIRNMVKTFGRELSAVGTEQTCLGRIEENFQRYNQEVQWFDGNKMMDDMRNDVMYMFNWKKHSVERIANESERIASNHTYDKNMEIDYYNVKGVEIKDNNYYYLHSLDSSSRPIKLTKNSNFDNAYVNLDHSAIHVPINVYDKSPDVVNDIKWSEHLTQFFKNNLAFDPSLSWQFFGSSKGFLRLYPATSWREQENYSDKELIDFYDCRMRPWYIKGAASPKDIVILLDTSGSMTGVRKSIGQNVVEYILDTLTDDDYVAALKFAKTVQPMHSCLDQLVQANVKNIKEIKESLADIKTNELVDFTVALSHAFQILQNFNRTGHGSQCNQAIMLITDGAPGTYEEVFRQYNWPNIPVRVFTYLIGQDASSHNEVYWMACHNRGYFTHVMNRGEIHEQVQKYIPVMSRPIVLSGERVFSWTPIYAPTYETELTEQTWKNKQNFEKINRLRVQARYAQEELDKSMNNDDNGDNDDQDQDQTIFTEHLNDNNDDDDVSGGGGGKRKKKRENNDKNEDNIISIPYKQMPFDTNNNNNNNHNHKRDSHNNINYNNNNNNRKNNNKNKISLYTTLSTPVFDTRNYTNITKRILIKNVYQDADIETIRIANLLGVAGVDIPIREIEKLTPSFKLGVNGYSFMITNNGYLLNHPDLRPLFEGFLKPFYHSVDMSEVELANNTLGPREPDPDIESIRGNMINRTHGWKKVAVKIHIDNMKRVITRVNHYTHGMIGHTPFSLAIALPEPYGSYRLTSQVDLRMKYREENFTHYFRGNQWRVHPEWAYCDNPHQISGQPQQTFSSPEESILQFLTNDLEKQNFRWRTSSIRPKVYETILCDKDLIQSLVLDANLTDIPNERCSSNPNYRDPLTIFISLMPSEQRIKTFGIVSTFVATRSGLTRFKDYRSIDEIKMLDDLPFYHKYDRAIEEIYYKRTVDFYTINKDAFVYTVEFDAGEQHERRMAKTHSRYDSNFLVTATHALFIGNLKHSTPVAVVGIQFRYDTLQEFFLNTTNKFNVPCTHLDVDCYLIDNNAFVVLSNHKTSDVGKFFGQIDGDILEELIKDGIYKRVHLYDYQAICLDAEIISGPSTNAFMFSIVNHLQQIFVTLIKWFGLFYLNLFYGTTNNKIWSLMGMDQTSFNVRQDNWMQGSVSPFDSEYTIITDLGDNQTIPRPCDKEFDLYEMINFSINGKSKDIECVQTNSKCSRTFLAQYIPHTNLLLIISINNPTCNCERKKLSIEPNEIQYDDEQYCQLLKQEKYRRRPSGCYNYHPQEKEIRQCGHSMALKSLKFLSIISSLISIVLFSI